MEDSVIAHRLKSLIATLGLTDSQFADRCSITRPTLSLLLAGKNKKISDVLLSQIHEAFPDVSILWLLFGEGEMLHSLNKQAETTKNTDQNSLFPETGPQNDQELNLVNLQQLENIIQNVVNKSFESSFISLENLTLKNLEKSPNRKVSKITVYYDDSTFDSFIPEARHHT